MTVNNLCSWLIVYGSYAPGGANHGVFAKLPGAWKKGKILCSLIEPPDGIGPEEKDEVEAWVIEFADCRSEIFTPEWEAEKRLLYQRWMEFDRAIGPEWARHSARWWPAGSAPVVGQNGMIAVNIYVPLKNYPYLKDRDDVPSPDEEADFHGMWRDVKVGRKRYDWSQFLGLIKDATPEQYADLFGDLPQGDEFIRKLRRFYQEHRKGKGNLLWDGVSEYGSWYVCRLEQHALSPDEMVALARADVANRAKLLRAAGFAEEASALAKLTFAFGKPQPAASADHSAGNALDHAADILLGATAVDDHWFACLREACYGIAAYYELAHWLMSHWYTTDIDFEPMYGLWKANGRYEVMGNTCHVYRNTPDIDQP